MLIDLHAHTSGISRCCRIPGDQVLKTAREYGMDGIALTNHYQKSYVENGDGVGFAEKYIEEYRKTKELGDAIGMPVFWGLEVTMELYRNVHMLIYGVPLDFPVRHPELYDMTQEGLYRLVYAEGGVLVQAHPFRNGATCLAPAFLDGVEINCHPLYKRSYSRELKDIAVKNHLFLTCGGDYHADTYRPKCGVILPDEVTDTFALAEFLRKNHGISLCIQEPNEDEVKVVAVS